MEFSEIVKKRYATKLFNGKTIPKEKIDALFELIRMSASSFGLQPYRIKIVTDRATKEKLQAASWNQPQVGTCSHLLVFCADERVMDRISGYEKLMQNAKAPAESIKGYIDMMKGFAQNLPKEKMIEWTKKQCYIALGNALNGATSLGFGACPMEGFSAEDYSKILNLPAYLHPAVVCPIGYAADTPRGKIRYSRSDLFIE